MEDPTILSLLAPLLDNSTLQVLSTIPIWNVLSSIIREDYYWYRRTQALTSRIIPDRSGDWKSVYYLIKNAISLHNPFTRCVLNNILAAEVLLDMGFDPSVENSYALSLACRYGHTDTVKLLLQDGRANPNARNNEALKYASQNDHAEVVGLLLQDGRVDPRVENNYALKIASEKGHTEVTRLLLLDGRADPSINNNHTLNYASSYGHIDIVRLLLQDRRVDPSAEDNYALKLASKYGHAEVVKLLEGWTSILK